MAHSTRKPAAQKPAKPYAGFPLCANGNGQWSKRIAGRVIYFGKWDDYKGALKRYLDERDEWKAGRNPRRHTPGGLTVLDMVNRYLDYQLDRVKEESISPRSFQDAKYVGGLIIKGIGKHAQVDKLDPDDFRNLRRHLGKGRSIATQKKLIGWVRPFFKFAVDERLIDRPVFYGRGFDSPATKAVKKQAKTDRPTYSREDIHKLLAVATPDMHCMIMLAINAGYGNTDIAQFSVTQALGLSKSHCVAYPRSKTGIVRQSPMWDETVEAVQACLSRRKASEHDCLFVTKYGNPWVTEKLDSADNVKTNDSIAKAFTKTCKAAGVDCHGFYVLRATFRTIADKCRDTTACKVLMGHEQEGMDVRYLRDVDQDRLQAAVDIVRGWLFGSEASNG